MKTSALRKEIHKVVDVVEDNEILEIVYAILNKTRSNYEQEFTPFTKEELLARHAKSKKDIKEGKLVSFSAFKKKYKIK
ncbi:MAG: hypothetical protein IAF38_19120 [Bacteroidia bacterium]|nr:hypothetical protein [Bacteroidia bacterium]